MLAWHVVGLKLMIGWAEVQLRRGAVAQNCSANNPRVSHAQMAVHPSVLAKAEGCAPGSVIASYRKEPHHCCCCPGLKVCAGRASSIMCTPCVGLDTADLRRLRHEVFRM